MIVVFAGKNPRTSSRDDDDMRESQQERTKARKMHHYSVLIIEFLTGRVTCARRGLLAGSFVNGVDGGRHVACRFHME